jgi:DNA-binding response OmpR family regulator
MHEQRTDGTDAHADLRGFRILVVEDEFLVALMIERALEAAGCQVVGPVGRLGEAVEAARAGPLDGAILDIHLHGETVSLVAERLLRAGVPVLFATAADARELSPELRELPCMHKPIDMDRLVALAARVFKGARAQPA